MNPCSAKTKSGRPCKAHAIRGSYPPLCSAHAGRNVGAGAPLGNLNALSHGFYSRTLTPEELSDLDHRAEPDELDDEIAAARINILRLMRILKHELSPANYSRLAGLIFTGANTVGRLMRTKRVLEGQAADGIAGAIAQALDEIGEELGIDL
jgi:uncharacterized protein YjcR